MTKLNESKYTLVQHSGFGYANKPGFEKAVETRSLSTIGEVRSVERAGGIVFDTYRSASDAEESVNGITSVDEFLSAKGEFSTQKIDGLRIYKPKFIDGKVR